MQQKVQLPLSIHTWLCVCMYVCRRCWCVAIMFVAAFVVGENTRRETPSDAFPASTSRLSQLITDCILHFTFQRGAAACNIVRACIYMCMLLLHKRRAVATLTNGKITFDATLSVQFANSLRYRELSRQLQQQQNQQSATTSNNGKQEKQ